MSKTTTTLLSLAIAALCACQIGQAQENNEPQVVPSVVPAVISEETLPEPAVPVDPPVVTEQPVPATQPAVPVVDPDAVTPQPITPAIDPDAVPPTTPAPAADARSLMKAAHEKTASAKTIADYSAIIDLCQQALAAGPNEAGKAYVIKLLAWSHNRRGKLYTNDAPIAADETVKAKLEAQALADFEIAVQHDPTKWQAVHNRGVSYAQVGRLKDALADFSKTIELNRTYANAWYNRGEIYYELNQLEKAVNDYSKAIELNPADSGAYSSRGHANYQLGNYRDAINDYNTAVKYDRTNAGAVTDRADVYANLGFWDRAARDYRTAVQMDKSLGRAYLGAAWLMATCPDQQYRDAKLAVDSANKAIQLDGKSDYRYLDTLAAALANAGEWDAAKTALDEAIEIAPEEQQVSLKTRLKMYESQQPYRDGTRTAQNGSTPPSR